MSDVLGNIQKAVKDTGGYPPVERWNPPFCGDIDMRIGRDGTWYYMGTPIGRKPMVRLLSRILRRDEDGAYYLVTPVEKCRIRVDDAPLNAVAVERVEGSLVFETATGDRVEAGADHPIRVVIDPETAEPSPYVHVRGRLEALISRPVFYELVEMAEERDGELAVTSGGARFVLGRVAP